jgi:hypothetical protein
MLGMTSKEEQDKTPLWLKHRAWHWVLGDDERDLLTKGMRCAPCSLINEITFWGGQEFFVRTLLLYAKDTKTHWADRSCESCLHHVGWAAVQDLAPGGRAGETVATNVLLRRLFAQYDRASDRLKEYWQELHYPPFHTIWAGLVRRGIL